MAARLTEVVIESADPAAAARFWAAALGWEVKEYLPGHVPWMSSSGDPAQHDLKLVFVAAPASRPARNRLYVNPSGADQADEIARLCGLGATRPESAGTTPWVGLVDPGGTELTILPNRLD